MTTLEVKSVEHLLGSGVPYAYAVKTGAWIFLTGHEAFDFTAGVGEAVAGPPGFPPTIVCSDFVFVAGQMASGREHGLDPRAHVPDHSLWAGTEIRKQTEFIIQERLKPALEAAGSSLERSVKAQVYIRDVDNFPDFVDVWSQHYRHIPCALTVVPTKGVATVGGIIEINRWR